MAPRAFGAFLDSVIDRYSDLVDHRIEEGAERRHLTRRAGQRPVEEVEQAGQDQEKPGAPRPPGDEGGSRQ